MFNEFYENRLIPFISQVRTACRAGAIPLSFDNSLSYYEQIAAFSAKLNEIICAVNNQNIYICDFMSELQDAFAALSGDFAQKWEEIQTEFGVIGGKISGMKLDISDLDERVTALENQPAGGVGETVEPGTFYRIGGTETPTPPEYGDYEADANCEIFNGYNGNAENGAAGNYSHSEGYHTRAMTNYSHAEGIDTIAAGTDGAAAHAEGNGSIATGAAAHAEGSNSRAYGLASHAEGAGTRATGSYSHAGGGGCTASGDCSLAHGNTCTASAANSVAFGAQTIASGYNQLVCGHSNLEKNNDFLFIIGNGITGTDRSNALEVDRYGNIYNNGRAKALNEITDENRAELIELVNVPGKNKLSFTEIGTNNSHGATFSSNGVDWTLNADFTITATRTSADSSDSSCNLRIDTGSLYIDDFCNGSFVLSGCPEGGGENTFSLRALRDDDYRVTDTGSGVILPDRETFSNIYINMLYDKEFSGTITFKPMICSKAAFAVSPAWIGPETPEASGGVTVYTNSDYTITPNTTGSISVNNLNATADGYLVGSLQTVHISGSYGIYYSISSDTGYKICDITVPGTITDPEKEIAITTNFDSYLAGGAIYNFYVAKIETVDNVKKLAIYFKSMGRSHGGSGQSFSFDITATFKVG